MKLTSTENYLKARNLPANVKLNALHNDFVTIEFPLEHFCRNKLKQRSDLAEADTNLRHLSTKVEYPKSAYNLMCFYD